jgi:hypothetical protein
MNIFVGKLYMQMVFQSVANICRTGYGIIHLSEIYVARKEDRRIACRTVVGDNTSWIAEDVGGGHVIKVYPGKTSYEVGRLKELAPYRVQWQTLRLADF